MQSERILTQAEFDALLSWLDPDRDQAALKYEEIRSRLIRVFISRGSPIAEELADETVNRVARKVKEIVGSYVGNPALYFYGVGRNVYRESIKSNPNPSLPLIPDPVEEDSPLYICLDRCMQVLPPESRAMILTYYQHTGQEKIDTHREVADSLGIDINALRIRIHRLRARLKDCVSRCLEGKVISMK